MTTMEEIAKALGISKGTVSKALSGAKDVGEATRQAVMEKALEMGYSRALRKANAPRFALFITNIAYLQPEDFGYDLVNGFRRAAEAGGYAVDVIPLTIPMQLETPYDTYIAEKGYCGGFLLGLAMTDDPWMKDFETCETPTVLYDNHVV